MEAIIRNFCIIAHIDHGKSTLADRFLEITKTIKPRDFRDQMLDDMDLERERGITIKSHPVQMRYRTREGRDCVLHLIDTPGHVDFSYEVSRSLSACEGAILLIDAAQGVQAQTVANFYLALEEGLEIIPVLNKIDLPNADPDRCLRQLRDLAGFTGEEVFQISAKKGDGVEDLLEKVIERVPPPSGAGDQPLQALIFDSIYNPFRGVIVYVRLFGGSLSPGDKVLLMNSEREYEVQEVGIFRPGMEAREELSAGEVGYIIANIKEPSKVMIGDTLTSAVRPCPAPLPGFKELRPLVFSGLYPVNSADYEDMKTALVKLRLNDPSFVYQPENSQALGFGFRCGFLGLLHMDIINERLQREYDINLVMTIPSVVYQISTTDGRELALDNPVLLPERNRIVEVKEPYIRAFIITPNDYIGQIMQIVQERRGECTSTESLGRLSVILTFEIPLNEVVIDFYDLIKSVTHGYGSLDYEHIGYRRSNLVKLEILLNKEVVDAFSSLVHREKARSRGLKMVERLKDVIPRHMFKIAVQASADGQIIARETIKPFRKDVTAKLYGGDRTRKDKLLKKQKAGKKKMKMVGKVQVPQRAFIEVLKLG
ncbi:MAG: translation elongation factor 4 [Candidatus Euphemobacter frigidus]|nr:translation elongation factor 4 [Candidatus Euphemobacter frigidus]MDP8276492.1 translation elongation factor 4 [Candidatus Euphemobacter frigidus]